MRPLEYAIGTCITILVGILLFNIGRITAPVPDDGYRRMKLGEWQDETGFEVDGVKYHFKGLYASVPVGTSLRSGKILITITPYEQKETVVPHVIFDRRSSDSVAYIEFRRLDSEGKKYREARHEIAPRFSSVCFVKDEKIVFSLTKEEAGIKWGKPEEIFSRENLLPILEKLIRENLPKDEIKSEEPEN